MSKYGVIAKLVWDGGDEVHVPDEMGKPREDQLRGTAGERLSELAGRVCYDSCGKGRSSDDYHKHIQEVGHFSVYEHHQMTVFVGDENMSGRTLKAKTIVNRPGLFSVFVKDGVRLTFNLRTLLDWRQWSGPNDFDSLWLLNVLCYYAEQAWPRVIRPEGRAIENRDAVCLCSRQIPPEHDEEKWISMFMMGSRGFSHELVRHGDRTAISQRSTRFVDEDGSPWVEHPLVQEYLKQHQDEEASLVSRDIEAVKTSARVAYDRVATVLHAWLTSKGVDKLTARKQARGAARGYLGNALTTELVFSASVAQWKRMMRMRCSDFADAEIRAVFVDALSAIKRSRYDKDFSGFKLKDASDGIGQASVEA